jgi:hypothetical protein
VLKLLLNSVVVTCAVWASGTSVAVALPAFSTAPKTAPDTGDAALLHDATAACHAAFDRFVVQADFSAPGYDVRYVGARRIRVTFSLAGGHDSRGTNLLAGTLTPRCPNLASVTKTRDSGGVVSFALSLRKRTGFRVFRLTHPTRVVIDVAH